MTAPAISVIVVAHADKDAIYDRSNYLLEALNSVVNQSLKRSLYEIILVKDFADNDVESLANKFGITHLMSENKSLGGKIRDGIEVSKGEIISFLEDDNIFETNKLEYVKEAFSENLNLGFINNSFSIIDEKGKVMDKSVYKNPKKDKNLTKGKNFRKNLTKQLKYSIEPHVDTASIRKEILIKHSNLLSSLQNSIDYFLFYSASISKFDMLISSKILNRYRIHGKSMIHYSANSITDILRRKTQNAMKTISDYKLLVKMFGNSQLQVFVGGLYAYSSIQLKLLGEISDFPFEIVFDSLRFSISRRSKEVFILSIFGLLSKIFPMISSKTYVKLLSVRH